MQARAKTGTEISCVEGVPLLLMIPGSGRLNSTVYVCGGSWGGLWRGRGLSSQREGMESSDTRGYCSFCWSY